MIVLDDCAMLLTGAYGTHHLEKCPFFSLPQHITTSLRGKVDGLYEQKDFLPTYFPSGWDVLFSMYYFAMCIYMLNQLQ